MGVAAVALAPSSQGVWCVSVLASGSRPDHHLRPEGGKFLCGPWPMRSNPGPPVSASHGIDARYRPAIIG